MIGESIIDFKSHELPEGLTLKPSGIPGVGMGVWTTVVIQPGIKMGPFEGKIIPIEKMGEEKDTSLLWEVHDRFGRILYTMDGKEQANWMKSVRHARHEDEKNLVAMQYERNIYYRAAKEIAADTELLVWYSNSYAQSLGLPTLGEIVTDDEGVYTCNRCSRSFCYPFSLLAHQKYNNCSTNNNLIWCDDCGMVFAWNFSLRAHIAAFHTSHRPYECLQCGKSFSQTTMLQAHSRAHHNLTEKLYSCTICSKTFPQSSQLRRHVRTHTGGKPYKCSECGKAFADSTNLRSHIRIHTGERPFKCVHCDRCFAEGSTLKSHVRTHTGEKPFKCSHCGKAFAHLSSHRKHTLTHNKHKLEGQLLPDLYTPVLQTLKTMGNSPTLRDISNAIHQNMQFTLPDTSTASAMPLCINAELYRKVPITLV